MPVSFGQNGGFQNLDQLIVLIIGWLITSFSPHVPQMDFLVVEKVAHTACLFQNPEELSSFVKVVLILASFTIFVDLWRRKEVREQ